MFLVYKKTAAYLYAAVFLILVDRFLKMVALNYFQANTYEVTSFFKFTFAKNFNIAFSLPLSGMILNIIILMILIFLLFVIKSEIKKNNWPTVGLLTIISVGALSNFYDRCVYGFVIDYLDIQYFTILNLADVMISVGVIVIITRSALPPLLDRRG